MIRNYFYTEDRAGISGWVALGLASVLASGALALPFAPAMIIASMKSKQEEPDVASPPMPPQPTPVVVQRRETASRYDYDALLDRLSANEIKKAMLHQECGALQRVVAWYEQNYPVCYNAYERANAEIASLRMENQALAAQVVALTERSLPSTFVPPEDLVNGQPQPDKPSSSSYPRASGDSLSLKPENEPFNLDTFNLRVTD